MRSMLGLQSKRGAHGLKTTGVRFDDIPADDGAVSMFFAPSLASASPLFPLPGRRARVYLAANPAFDDKAYAGAAAAAPLLARLREIGVLGSWLGNARVAGPLATFDGTPTSAEGPWPEGVTLIGDAAGSLDPAFGSGLSLALLDARTFTDKLARGGDFGAASRAYAEERAAYYAKLLRVESWVGRVLYGVGAEDGVPHPELLPRLTELEVDLVGGGPHCRIDDAIERQLFGPPRAN
jgi:2-polyprenyl-6-methoxyphenol hydroxylase-like FAD-dependent oxidoreductase